MSDQKAKVTSVEALEKFHKCMLTYSEESLSTLEKVRCEILRRMQQMESQLPAHWQREHDTWKVKMKDAQRERTSARTSSGRLAAEQAYRQAKSKVKNAEEKMAAVKKWNMRLNNEIPEYQTRLLKLKTFLINDFEKGTGLLKEHAATLHEYTKVSGNGK